MRRDRTLLEVDQPVPPSEGRSDPGQPADAGAPEAERPLQILILEDRAMDADLVIRQLRRAGFEIQTTIVSDEASYLRALGSTPDIILADYSLPRFDALRALRHLRARDLDIPFIVVTGTITEETAVAALREGAADYLLKDRLGRLPDAVRRALADQASRQRAREAEQALRESEARYRAVSELTFDFAYAALVLPDGTLAFEWTTDAISRITGYTAEQLRTLDDVAALVHSEDRAALFAHLNRAISGRADSRDCRLTTRGGDERVLRLHIRPELDGATGRVVRVYGAVQDLTEQRRYERALQEANVRLSATLDELRETQQQIIQQERLRALGEMASGIAHDFNNALTMILGFSELMLAEPGLLTDVGRVRQNLQLVSVAAQDAASIVRRLSELYRERDSGEETEPVEMQAVVSTAIALTEPKWRAQAQARGVQIAVRQVVEQDTVALASEGDLRELLTNLIINAVDACEDSGTITIRARSAGDAVLLEVADSGHGMSDEVRARCLEPYFTTKKDRGTGLGLPMVHRIVRRHGGTISIESATGQGTTIGVRLPRAAPETVNVAAPAATGPGGSWRVLVVDDEEGVRTILSRYLLHAGHQVNAVATAGEALAALTAGGVDLLMLDRAMPDMSGDQLAILARRVAPQTRILMLSGFGAAPGADGTAPAVDGILAKPIRMAELVSAIAQVMGADLPDRGAQLSDTYP